MVRRDETNKQATPQKRKLIGLQAQLLQALQLFARDSKRSIDSLADEAFRDLLDKHQRPITLREALRQSTRRQPANDDVPPPRRGRT